MLNRELLQTQTEHDICFLDDRWDDALIGYVESGRNGGRIKPCYSYELAKFHLVSVCGKNKKVSGRLAYFQSLDAIVFMAHPSIELDYIAKSNKLILFSELNDAIIGIAYHNKLPSGVIYDKAKSISILMRARNKNKSEIENTINEHYVPLALGDQSPWFFNKINYNK